jgi:arginyl-tRNA synthetase
MNLLHTIQGAVRAALTGLTTDVQRCVEMVKPAQDAKHGDYQANCAMSLAKEQGKKPRDVAQTIVDRLPLCEILEKPEIAGPGFINLRVRGDWLASALQAMSKSDRLGVGSAEPPRTYVIDFSSPNVAKPMHVGHLRSTILGDSLARLFQFLGHKVVRDNHLGDWGTQFGILLYGYKHFLDRKGLEANPVSEMLRLYIHVRNLIKPAESDEDDIGGPGSGQYTAEQIAEARQVAEAARQETAKLHRGDAENVALWTQFMPWCLEVNERLYKRLDVRFDVTLGESFYNPMLADVVASLKAKGIARDSQGAVAVFFGEGKPPALVQKNDGAFTYTTTDLATVRYRVETWNPDVALYVVDARQALHFQNVFDIARRWGYDRVALEHISFGSVLGEDRKPLKTREGGVIELGALLDEAIQRAEQVFDEAQAEEVGRGETIAQLPADEKRRLMEAVGIGAVKYADLCQNRTTDYVFNWSKMLAMNGNTGTYMQYAYVRNRAIFRKVGVDPTELRADPSRPMLDTPHERALGLALLRFEEALADAAGSYQPHVITAYLWDLSKAYSGFFQNCPVMRAPTPELRQSRLLLCDLTARVLQRGLDLLGIRVVERM